MRRESIEEDFTAGKRFSSSERSKAPLKKKKKKIIIKIIIIK